MKPVHEFRINCECGNPAEFMCQCGTVLCGDDPCNKCNGSVFPIDVKLREKYEIYTTKRNECTHLDEWCSEQIKEQNEDREAEISKMRAQVSKIQKKIVKIQVENDVIEKKYNPLRSLLREKINNYYWNFVSPLSNEFQEMKSKIMVNKPFENEDDVTRFIRVNKLSQRGSAYYIEPVKMKLNHLQVYKYVKNQNQMAYLLCNDRRILAVTGYKDTLKDYLKQFGAPTGNPTNEQMTKLMNNATWFERPFNGGKHVVYIFDKIAQRRSGQWTVKEYTKEVIHND